MTEKEKSRVYHRALGVASAVAILLVLASAYRLASLFTMEEMLSLTSPFLIRLVLGGVVTVGVWFGILLSMTHSLRIEDYDQEEEQ